MSTVKLPILKKGEYDIWAIKMEHYLAHTNYPIWEVIQKGNGPVSITTAEETLARERDRKAMTTLLMALPEDHLAKFHKRTDAKEMWNAIKSRFSSNNESNQDARWRDAGNSGYKAKDNGRRPRKYMNIDLDDKTDVLTYHKKLLAEALKEKDDLKTKFENSQNSSKNLGKLLNTQMSANDKFGLGYGDHRFDGILSYENEVLQSVFMNKESKTDDRILNDRFVTTDGIFDGILSYENEVLQSVFMNKESKTDDRILNDRFVTTDGMYVVSPPMTWNYMPLGPDIEIDESQFTYGLKQPQSSEPDTRSSNFDSYESNSSVETPDCMPVPVVTEPKVVSTPKVWTDTPIIEKCESDSDDEYVSTPSSEQE
ncbi:hypothetical protein Tco_0170071 [Tanacetum coccineum]